MSQGAVGVHGISDFDKRLGPFPFFSQFMTAAILPVQALHAFELALSLEKLNYQKLWHLDDIATKAEDYEMASMVEEMLHNQVASMHMSRHTACVALPLFASLCLWRKFNQTVVCQGSKVGHTSFYAQAEEVKRAADQVSQLRRVGKGLGVFEFDRAIANAEEEEEG